MKNSIQVENYWIREYENGIICLVFNTKDRWIYFHKYNDTMYQIGGTLNCSINSSKYIQEIPKNLIPETNHICCTMQEKDQISFYYIPYSMLFNKGKVLYNSRDKKF